MLVIAQIQAQTGLDTQWAGELAATAGFDLGAAAAKFEEMRVSRGSSDGICGSRKELRVDTILTSHRAKYRHIVSFPDRPAVGEEE
jgi:hypothetical protein